ncbi:MAG: GNAT family N-acetyltransferase, partial [Hyphomicrobiales bacterium]
DFRGQGVAHGLMVLLEEEARRLKKTLITLDTRTGDKAEKLYGTLGFAQAGIIPNFALDPDCENTHATTYMYKEL